MVIKSLKSLANVKVWGYKQDIDLVVQGTPALPSVFYSSFGFGSTVTFTKEPVVNPCQSWKTIQSTFSSICPYQTCIQLWKRQNICTEAANSAVILESYLHQYTSSSQNVTPCIVLGSKGKKRFRKEGKLGSYSVYMWLCTNVVSIFLWTVP